ncbi:MAG: protein kinase [Myxococcales bacterium]|nr:protein kinase [Myxococcales bacterium]
MSPVSPADQHARIKQVFLRALERPRDEHAALLDALCGDDVGLRGEVESLLAHHRQESLLAAPRRADADDARGRERPDLAGSVTEAGGLAPTRARAEPWSAAGSAAAADGSAGLPRLGRYTPVGMLGEGGMGVVYVALDELLDRKVAIKLLRHRGGGPAAHFRMLREAQALARLAHPNVIAIHDVGEADGQIYLAMELVTGGTLRAWLKERPRTQAEILAVFSQAAAGLAAAHAAGLVHRDFKPDNVMIGADGRVRVMDFGLARAPHGNDATTTSPDGGSILDADVTVHGSLIGTPAYMAPEQLLGRAADTRSDLYGFCVALHEALHGERPFPGAADPAQAVAQRHAPPTASAGQVPAWLQAVVLRGLAYDPEDRWPSLPALLAALARDPIAARRRLVRVVGLTLVVVGLTVAAALGVVDLRQRWARERAEQLAGERLAAVDEAAARAAAQGRPEQGEAMFQAFVADPEHRGTAVLARAWLRRGDQQRRAGSGAAALAAYARAYVEARDPDAVVASLQAMAAVFRDEWNGPALLQVVAALRARGVDDDDVARLAAFADLRVRDLPGAAAELARVEPDAAGLLTALAVGHTTAIDADGLDALAPRRAPAASLRRPVLLDDELQTIGHWDADGERLHPIPGTSWVLARRGEQERLFDVHAPDQPLWRGASAASVFRVHAVDLDADGTPELLFGRTAPVRGFRALTGLGGGDPRERPAHRATDQTDSDIDAIVAEDLDGDGRREVVVAVGAWQAYDVRVFRVDDAGRLELAARRRLGRVGALTVVRRGDRRWILAVKDDHYPSPQVFPTPPHTGPPAGAYLLRWADDRLEIDGFAALPVHDGVSRYHALGAIHAGDFDGDGLDEAAALLRGVDGDELGVVRLGPDAALEWMIVAGLAPQRTVRDDADAADELLVVSGDEQTPWILGAGDAPLPTRRPPPHDPHPPPATLADPLLALRWTRADELAAIGLPAEAAASLQEAANQTADPDARRDLLDRAAAFHVAAGADAAALAIDRELTGAAALARDVGALLRLGHHDEAYARAGELLAGDLETTPEQRAEVLAVHARLAPLIGAGVKIDFADPLAPAWQIDRPAALRRDAAGRALALAAFSDERPVARLPLAWSGGPLHVDLEFTLDRVEYGACVRVGVRDDAGREWFAGGVCGVGGGGRVSAALNCQSSIQSFAHGRPAERPSGARMRLRLTRFDAAFTCTLETPDGTLRHELPPRRPPATGRYWLVIGGPMRPGERSDLASGALHRLEVRGAALADTGPPTPEHRAAALLVEGEPLAALAALAEVPPEDRRRPLWQALAHDDRNDFDGVDRAVAGLSPDLSDPTWSEELALVLRTRPAVAVAVRRRFGAAALPLLDRTYGALASQHRGDRVVADLVLAAIRGVEAVAPTTPGERVALRRLLVARAGVWHDRGEPARAQRDREAALAVPAADTDEDDALRAEVLVALAGARVASDPAAALALLEAAVAASPAPTRVRLQIGDDPRFAALVADDPAWIRLVREP